MGSLSAECKLEILKACFDRQGLMSHAMATAEELISWAESKNWLGIAYMIALNGLPDRDDVYELCVSNSRPSDGLPS